MGYGGEGIYRSSVISLAVNKLWSPFGSEAHAFVAWAMLGNAVVDTQDCNTYCGIMRERAATSPIRRFLFLSADVADERRFLKVCDIANKKR